MKRIKSFALFTCIMIVSSYTANAQNVVPNSEALLAKLRLNGSIGGINHETYEQIAGDPYIYKDFHEGELILKNGDVYRSILRYDIFGDQIHLKNEDNIYGIIHPEKITLIVIDTVKFLYSTYLNSPALRSTKADSYFILKTDGKCKLLIRKNIRIQDAEPPKLLQDAQPAKFIHTNDSYYLKLENENAILIRSKQDILFVLADQKTALNQYINSNKFNVKKIADLIRIVDYYNNL